MLLYQGIITLDYDPATDVLVAAMPDARQFGPSEVRYCLGLIAASVRNYGIGCLLLDARLADPAAEGEGQRSEHAEFTAELLGTRLRRMARLAGADGGWEGRSAGIAAGHLQGLRLPVAFRSFTSQAEAMGWLLSPEPA